ncbi:MAG: dihydroxyacetone kinase subunit DhaL [Bacteroidales bacterium]
MDTFRNMEGALVVDRMIEAIRDHKQYLSDIDGAIGDGDHGINMNKGFTMTREALDNDPGDFSHALLTLARVLMMRIGGSMGPLYGKTFQSMGKTFADHEEIDAELFRQALAGARESMLALSPARVGDKTLVDALYPAIDAFEQALQSGTGFREALTAMKKAAEEGKNATEDMVARLGRSSRLGERSRGVVDAGAASCALLLGVMADTIIELL